MMRLQPVLVFLLLAACYHPDYRRDRDYAHDWTVPTTERDVHVSEAMSHEEMGDYTERMAADGWRVIDCVPTGERDPQRYHVVLTRYLSEEEDGMEEIYWERVKKLQQVEALEKKRFYKDLPD